jgi:thioredoxin 1
MIACAGFCHDNLGYTAIKEQIMAKPIKVTDATFEETITSGDTPVLVDFWAEWCGPCKMIAPVLEELATELDGKLIISKLDVDENPDTAQAFGVMSIPTLLVFKGGKPVDRIVGFQQKAQLKKRLAAHYAAPDGSPDVALL